MASFFEKKGSIYTFSSSSSLSILGLFSEGGGMADREPAEAKESLRERFRSEVRERYMPRAMIEREAF